MMAKHLMSQLKLRPPSARIRIRRGGKRFFRG